MNPFLYAQHETARLCLNLMSVGSHMSGAHLRSLCQLFEMHPCTQILRQAGEHFDNNPVAVTMNHFNALAEWVPGMADFADRLPEHISLHLGANHKISDDMSNKPLENDDHSHLHLHINSARPDQNMHAMGHLFDMLSKDFGKPEYGITNASINGENFPVEQKTLLERDFIDLIHFDSHLEDAPKVLVCAPMSGHFSTLLRERIQSHLNAGMDVYVVDINNARDVPLRKGTMDLNGLADRYAEFMQELGPVHLDATCQAAVPALISSAWLAKNDPEKKPLSMLLVSAPIDTDIAPAEIVDVAREKGIDTFKNSAITIVPPPYAGAGRLVNPGFLQVTSFMMLNPRLHAHSYGKIFNHLVVGAEDDVQGNIDFYKEFMAWSDMEGPYNVQTLEEIFMNNLLAKGEFLHHGDPIDLTVLKGIPLFTMEAGKDLISPPGQTVIAHELTQADQGYHYEIEGVGHYGSFHGKGARIRAFPRIATFIHMVEEQNGNSSRPLLGADGWPFPIKLDLKTYTPEMLERAINKTTKAYEEIQQAKIEKRDQESDIPSLNVTLPG